MASSSERVTSKALLRAADAVGPSSASSSLPSSSSSITQAHKLRLLNKPVAPKPGKSMKPAASAAIAGSTGSKGSISSTSNSNSNSSSSRTASRASMSSNYAKRKRDPALVAASVSTQHSGSNAGTAMHQQQQACRKSSIHSNNSHVVMSAGRAVTAGTGGGSSYSIKA
eukprot:1432-Heterococcus_DN1.PRE.1